MSTQYADAAMNGEKSAAAQIYVGGGGPAEEPWQLVERKDKSRNYRSPDPTSGKRATRSAYVAPTPEEFPPLSRVCRGLVRRATSFTTASEDAVRRKLAVAAQGTKRDKSRTADEKRKVERVAMGKRVELIIDYCLTNKVGSVKGEKWFRKTHGKAHLVRKSIF
jgi:hypothetical protein